MSHVALVFHQLHRGLGMRYLYIRPGPLNRQFRPANGAHWDSGQNIFLIRPIPHLILFFQHRAQIQIQIFYMGEGCDFIDFAHNSVPPFASIVNHEKKIDNRIESK